MPQNGNSFIESLYLRKYDHLLRTAYCLTEDQALAENIVHETFVLAILHQKELASHPKPDAWLLRSLHNLIQTDLRSASRRDVPLDEAIEVPAENPPLPLAELLPSGLKPEERKILILCFEEQMSYKRYRKYSTYRKHHAENGFPGLWQGAKGCLKTVDFSSKKFFQKFPKIWSQNDFLITLFSRGVRRRDDESPIEQARKSVKSAFWR